MEPRLGEWRASGSGLLGAGQIWPTVPSDFSLQAFYYPEEAGLAFGGPSSSRFLRLEVHYHNPLALKGKTCLKERIGILLSRGGREVPKGAAAGDENTVGTDQPLARKPAVPKKLRPGLLGAGRGNVLI